LIWFDTDWGPDVDDEGYFEYDPDGS